MNFRDTMTLLKTRISIEDIVPFTPTITAFIPRAADMIGFDQKNHAHQYDLWDHCLHTILNLPRDLDDPMLYLAALLHDIGKLESQCRGKREDDPNMHYYGHPQRSLAIVRDEVIPTLAKNDVRLTEDEQRRLLYYVEYHDDRVSLRPKHLRRHLQMVSMEEFKNLMHLQVADAKAHVMLPIIEERIRICTTWTGPYADEVYQELLSSGSL